MHEQPTEDVVGRPPELRIVALDDATQLLPEWSRVYETEAVNPRKQDIYVADETYTS